ncbi:MAG: pseudouridine synthase [Wenyingzhuangia sp.]|uniref:pseudouridine synthase n=1 Tax=Wenyingzhuangia sp. TaxID=1964193 RepID=UPI0032194D18
MTNPKYFHFFKNNIKDISAPEKFTYPFYYDPHPLSIMATKEVQAYLMMQTDFNHHFENTGKMFGVLVVQTKNNEIGFLASVSGKLADTNTHKYFVPPVFDMLPKKGYYKTEEHKLNILTQKIETLEKAEIYNRLKRSLTKTIEKAEGEKNSFRLKMIEAKKERKERRKQIRREFEGNRLQENLKTLDQESIIFKLKKRDLYKQWDRKIVQDQKELSTYEDEITKLQMLRKEKSSSLQRYLFQQYQFLNKKKEAKNLLSIFEETSLQVPPAAAGECAAPKLLQYAFQNQLTPICMAEFWWGKSPNSEIRKHKIFYPACQGKCKPILNHMLKGMLLDTDPLLKNPAIGKELEYLYEDQYMVVVNKPSEFLSVPGKTIDDSVYLRIKQKYPKATGPLIVHRLDMSTSGIMILALDIDTYKKLQRQFIKRQVKKRYLAILDGIVERNNGTIELPLRLDVEDRPRQLVCYEHGKKAKTIWKVIDRTENKTKIHLYPITGRTHQLRVHASHPEGLNTPIIGDDLYGSKGRRLLLHAEHITLHHPETKEEISFSAKAYF